MHVNLALHHMGAEIVKHAHKLVTLHLVQGYLTVNIFHLKQKHI